MTRKDYVLIAATLAEGTLYNLYGASADARHQHALMCNDMAVNLAAANPNFKRAVFLKACGLDDDTIDSL